jgi:hypothetical protein
MFKQAQKLSGMPPFFIGDVLENFDGGNGQDGATLVYAGYPMG